MDTSVPSIKLICRLFTMVSLDDIPSVISIYFSVRNANLNGCFIGFGISYHKHMWGFHSADNGFTAYYESTTVITVYAENSGSEHTGLQLRSA